MLANAFHSYTNLRGKKITLILTFRNKIYENDHSYTHLLSPFFGVRIYAAARSLI